ncbi:MAG: hypothetical protein E7212_13755 [Clostridium sartagoforme]|nr:hypothetical protein [Clostridium sartagoforme]
MLVKFSIYFCAYFFIMPILTIFHELGHAAFALALTNSNVYLEIGSGIKRIEKQIGRLNFKFKGYKNLYDVSFGIVKFKIAKSKIARIFILLGGPLVSLVIFLLTISINILLDNFSFGIKMTLNSISIYSLGQFLSTILPIKYRFKPYVSMCSDGYQILQMIKAIE